MIQNHKWAVDNLCESAQDPPERNGIRSAADQA
jgi:hypothetical protein